MVKNIEIRTTQNVLIHYELANTKDRILAQVIDLIVKIVVVALFYFIINSIGSYEENMWMLVVLPWVTFYSLMFETLWKGQTPGKRLIGLKVIHVEGQQMNFIDYLIRWSFRIVDLYFTAGVLAILLVSSNERNQRLGDQMAQCTVVRQQKNMEIALQDILRIDSKKTYLPQYPLIAQFHEEDIFLIKETIERFKQFQNKAHFEALKELSTIMQSRVECQDAITDHVQFLRTLIKDYVVLTR